MSDELDPVLSRLFAEATQPLPDDGFQARVMGHLSRPSGWLDVTSALSSMARAIFSGVTTAFAAPFRSGLGGVGLMAAAGAVVMITLLLRSLSGIT